MLDKLKQLKQIRDLQKSLESELIEFEKEGVRVVFNGKMEMQEIVLNPDLSKEKQESLIKENINCAIKELQTKTFEKMKSMKGLGL